MGLRSTNLTWGSLAKSFHWIVAALIFTQFALGWIAHEWPRSPTKLDLFVWHKSIGILVLLLAVLRLCWRAIDARPPLPQAMGRAERIAAWISHALLYVLMLALPLSGWIINSAANFPLKLFWLVPLPPITAPGKQLQELAEDVHLVLFWLLAGVVLVHVAAALRHHFSQHDPVLRRMLPGTGKETASP
jgi:cytochrome b561